MKRWIFSFTGSFRPAGAQPLIVAVGGFLLCDADDALLGDETAREADVARGEDVQRQRYVLDDAGVEAGRRVLILLTDGANTAGAVDPLKAADLAAQRKMVIYTVGIGADALTVRSLFGLRQINPSADLDEATLTAVAQKTGGRYFRARDTEEFAQIYNILDQLEPADSDEEGFRPVAELFYWPLGAALAIALALGVAGLLVAWRGAARLPALRGEVGHG